jgi:hypothetical protein
MWKAVWIGGHLLYHEPWRRNRYPFVYYLPDRKRNGAPFGVIEPGIPIQDALNKRESKALNMLSNRRIIAEENAVENIEEAQRENSKADGYVEVKQGYLSGQRILFPDNQDVGQGQIVMLQEAKAALPAVMGIGADAMGMPTQLRSAAGVARKQQMTQLVITPLAHNLKQYRRLKASLQLELIRDVFDAPMTFHVTDDPNAARYVELTKDDLLALKERTYDIVLKESPDYLTVREQQLDMIFQLWPQIAPLGPGMMKVALAMTDLKDKENFMRMIDEAVSPQPQLPKTSLSFSWENLSDQERAYFALTMFQSPELAQFLAERAGDPAWLAKIKADLAKTQIKEGTRAQQERGILDFNAMKTAMEGMLEAKKLSGDSFLGGLTSGAQGNPDSVQPDQE